MCELPMGQSRRDAWWAAGPMSLKLESEVGAGCGDVVVVKTRREDKLKPSRKHV